MEIGGDFQSPSQTDRPVGGQEPNIMTSSGLFSTIRLAAAACAIGLLAPMAANAELLADPPGRGHTFHHRVLWIKDPSAQAVLSWTTREMGEDHILYYDTVSHGGDVSAYANSVESFKDGKFTMQEADERWVRPAYFHHAHLSGLEPETTYYVVFSSDGQPSEEFNFRTAYATDQEFSMLFGGDSRIAGSDPYEHTDRQKMNLRLRAMFEEEPNVLGLVHGGDYCMLAQWRYLEPWLNDHEMTTTSTGRLMPIIPARGNHDRDIGYVEMFSWPDLPRDYYFETRLSPSVTLLTLNTEISLGGDQRDWLAETLERVRPENRWLLVQYHRPSYSSVRNMQDGASRRNNWVPLFEQFNVDLVYESHDHALKRTLPIRSHAPDLENGIVYVGDGGLGVPQRTPNPSYWWLQEPGMTMAAHHAHIMRFGEEELHLRAIGMDAEVLDDFVMQPRQIAVGK